MKSLSQIRNDYKLYKLSIFDLLTALLGTILIFYLLWLFTPIKKNIKLCSILILATILTLPIGIITHLIFGVKTQLNFELGLSGKPQ